MTDADRLDALRLLFLAGGNIGDGARKVVGLVLSREEPVRHADLRATFGTSRTNAWRWIADARDAGLIPPRGAEIGAEDVNVGRLRELAGKGGEEPSP